LIPFGAPESKVITYLDVELCERADVGHVCKNDISSSKGQRDAHYTCPEKKPIFLGGSRMEIDAGLH